MAFISQKEIEERVNRNQLFERDTYSEKCFSTSGASYDLRLGEEVFVTPETEPKQLSKNQTLNIEPGQFAALTTEEYIKMPNDLIGFITIRFRYKSKGLVNISGFHVDPGWEGKLIFSVYNVGPSTISLRQGEKVFSIFFATIHPETSYKRGEFSEQKRIPLSIIESLAGARAPSLQKLEDQVKTNWTYIKIYGGIIIGLLITVVVALLTKGS